MTRENIDTATIKLLDFINDVRQSDKELALNDRMIMKNLEAKIEGNDKIFKVITRIIKYTHSLEHRIQKLEEKQHG